MVCCLAYPPHVNGCSPGHLFCGTIISMRSFLWCQAHLASICPASQTLRCAQGDNRIKIMSEREIYDYVSGTEAAGAPFVSHYLITTWDRNCPRRCSYLVNDTGLY